jgi:hypothetical protein
VAALGISTFAKNLGAPGVPEEATDPASCGVVEGASAAKPARHGVETGGTPPLDLKVPLAVTGAAFLLLSAVLLLWRRSVRLTSGTDDDRPAR